MVFKKLIHTLRKASPVLCLSALFMLAPSVMRADVSPVMPSGTAVSLAQAVAHPPAPANELVKVAPLQKTQADKKQLWNLQDADIRAVIQTVSSITGKNFVVDPQVQGKVTIISTQPMGNEEVYRVFLSMLQVLNYAAVPAGDVIKIVPAAVATQDGGTFITGEQLNGDQIVVRVVPVQNVSATQMVPILRPLMQQWGSITAYDPANTLILAGTANNVNRLTRIVQKMDQENASGISVITLKYASAEKLVNVLQQLLTQAKTAGRGITLSIIADTDNNSILLAGSERDRLTYAKLIKQLDTGQESENASTVVIHLNYLSAKEVATLLTKIAHGEVLREKKNNAAGTNNYVSASAGSSSDDNSLVSIQAETNDNAVVISAPANIVQSLRHIIDEIDVPPQQVLVEAIIVQLTEQLAKNLGISWGTAPPASAVAALAASGGDPSSSFQQGVGYIPGGNIQLLLNALQNNTSADILSTPSILVINNQTATISDGETVSMINRQYSQTNAGDNSFTPFNTLSRENVALTLKVTPQISPNNMVKLKINQQDNSLQGTPGQSDQPAENTSSIKTTVLVHSGDILVLGGLLKNDTTKASSEVPILGDIPLLGELFHSKNDSMDKENLMVFIKPVIINTRSDAVNATRQRYQYMRYQQQSWNSGIRLHQDSQLAPVLPGPSNEAPSVQLPPPVAQ